MKLLFAIDKRLTKWYNKHMKRIDEEREEKLFIDEENLKNLEVDLKELTKMKVKNDKLKIVVHSLMAPLTGILGAGILFDFEKVSGIVLFSIFSAFFMGGSAASFMRTTKNLDRSKKIKKLVDEEKYDEVIKETKNSKNIDYEVINNVATLIKEKNDEKFGTSIEEFHEVYQDL